MHLLSKYYLSIDNQYIVYLYLKSYFIVAIIIYPLSTFIISFTQEILVCIFIWDFHLIFGLFHEQSLQL